MGVRTHRQCDTPSQITSEECRYCAREDVRDVTRWSQSNSWQHYELLINQGVNADVVVSTVKINPEKGGVEPKAKKDGAVAERQAETNCKGTVRGDVRCWKNEFVWMFGHVLLMHPSSILNTGSVGSVLVVRSCGLVVVSVDGQNRYRCLLLIPKVRVSMPGKLQEFVFFWIGINFWFFATA